MSEKQEVRKGVFICHCGGNISDVVDCEQVAKEIAKLDGVIVSSNEVFMCSDPAQNSIIDSIKEHKLNRVVVASCSPRLHETTFRNTAIRAGLNPYLYEHVNIREQVSWVHSTADDEATNKAIKLIAAALGKLDSSKELHPITVNVTPHALVIGGGVAGIRAALDFSARGIPVTLIEKSPFLGGRMAQLDHVFPTEEKARDLIKSMVDQVTSDKLIEVYVSSNIKDVEGYVGNYHVTIETDPQYLRADADESKLKAAIDACEIEADDAFNYSLIKRKAIYKPFDNCYPDTPAIDLAAFGSVEEAEKSLGEDIVDSKAEAKQTSIKVGTILFATGFTPYTPKQDEFGYGKRPDVVTLPEFIRLLDESGPSSGKLSLDGREINSVGFMHCVGSRQVEGIHEPKEGRDLNLYCSRVCCTAILQAALEVKEKHPDIRVFDFYKDIRTYGRYHEEYYTKASKAGVVFFKYDDMNLPKVKDDDSKQAALAVEVIDKLTFDEQLSVPMDLLVLAVGIEPSEITDLIEKMKLPIGTDGFLSEVHPKLRPVELASQGLFLAGTAQAPMTIDEAVASASAVVAKASRILCKDQIELDPFVAVVNESKCEGEGLCISQCEYAGAITLVEKIENGKTVKKAQVNSALCKGCGSCVAVCPHNAIDIAGSTMEQLYAMVDAIAG